MPAVIDQIIRSKRKTMAIIVRPDASVIVRVPLRASDQSVQDFIVKNQDWIEKKQAQARSTVLAAPKQYAVGQNFEFLGKAYPLEIAQGQRKILILDDGRFKLAESAQEKAEAVFIGWYRDQARLILQERVEFYARQNGLQYKKIGITSARTRWGSCSASGSLNFSWRLIQAPMDVVDYVVVHELVHTIHHNHSKQFWKKVEQVMPDYRERRKWLRKNGQRLLL